MTDIAQQMEEVLARIKQEKKARKLKQDSPAQQHFQNVILEFMTNSDRLYAGTELEAHVDMSGISYRTVPGRIAIMVAHGGIERVRAGWYRLPRTSN